YLFEVEMRAGRGCDPRPLGKAGVAALEPGAVGRGRGVFDYAVVRDQLRQRRGIVAQEDFVEAPDYLGRRGGDVGRMLRFHWLRSCLVDGVAAPARRADARGRHQNRLLSRHREVRAHDLPFAALARVDPRPTSALDFREPALGYGGQAIVGVE